MEFAELDELYGYLEEHAGDHKYPHQIADLFKKIRDLKHESGKTDEAQKSQWEMDCFNFMITKGELKPKFSGTDEKGHPFEYPDKSRLNDEELDYIAGRFSRASNPILKARYAHILWSSRPRKHSKYAEAAIDSYLELVKFYEEKDKKDSHGHFGLDVLKCIEQASLLAFQIGYRVDDIRFEINRLVIQFNPNSSSAFVMRAHLIRHMLDDKADFPPDCFAGFPDVCLILALKLFKEGEFHNAINIFEAGERVDNKLGHKTHDWNRSIAESYEGLMNQRSESDLAATSFCQRAIEYYKKSKDETAVKELENKYEQLRGKQKFQTFSVDIDVSEYRKKWEEYVDKILNEGPECIISFLMFDASLLPKYKSTEDTSKAIAEKTVLLNIMPVSVIDERGHTAEHFSTDEEKKYYNILHHYSMEIMTGRRIIINDIFLKAVEKDKLNIHTVMEYFEKNSWFGKNITKRRPNNEIVTYNWLNMIAPSINEYFNQVQAHFLEPSYDPNLVLPIDSLILKIEGLVRDICAISEITTFYLVRDQQGRSIVRERDINWLLRTEPIKKLFNEDDLLFFKFMLVEKAGLNLRHKVAHCLIDYSEYSITYMHLLLLVLFRLGKYDFVKPDETVEEKIADPE